MIQRALTITGISGAQSECILTDLPTELKAIAAESIGWQPLGDGAYLHLSGNDRDATVIQVVGVPDASMAGIDALLLVG